MTAIDINCDLGEGYGDYRSADDAAIIPFISSANIACGFHAGDPAIMEATIQAAVKHGVAVGAHPGFYDLQGFGRRRLALTPREVYQITLYQLGALNAFARAAQTNTQHLKPHGALYHLSATEILIAEAIVQAVHDFDRKIIVYGPPGSCLLNAALQHGLAVAREGFADRRYLPDGSLLSRTNTGALITDPAEVLQQVSDMIFNKQVVTDNGTTIKIEVETICIHSDTPGAAQLVKHISDSLRQCTVLIKAPAAHED